MVRVGIRVILTLGLQLVSSRFGLFYVDFYMDRYISVKYFGLDVVTTVFLKY